MDFAGELFGFFGLLYGCDGDYKVAGFVDVGFDVVGEIDELVRGLDGVSVALLGDGVGLQLAVGQAALLIRDGLVFVLRLGSGNLRFGCGERGGDGG